MSANEQRDTPALIESLKMNPCLVNGLFGHGTFLVEHYNNFSLARSFRLRFPGIEVVFAPAMMSLCCPISDNNVTVPSLGAGPLDLQVSRNHN